MSAMRSSAGGKPHFGPWLIEQVKSGQYVGLRMMDNDTFRIPWKHNGRKNLEDEDVKIFKEWAVVSGKIQENPNDKAKWKRNFRCALNSLSKYFEIVHDRSQDQDDPHKIFRIIHPQNHQVTQNVEPNVPFIAQVYNTTDMSQDMEQDLLDQIDSIDLNPPYTEPQLWETSQQNIQTGMSYNESPDSGVQDLVQNHTPLPVQQPQPIERPIICNINDLEITISYRKTEVFKTFLNSSLVHFHYRCDPTELKGFPLRFPSTENLVDHVQIELTERILESIERGLQLEITPDGIYGFRQDSCIVYVSTRDPSEIQNPEPRKLQRKFREQLFSFEKYWTDLQDFVENKRGSPDYTIYLCFGEKLPDEKPLNKKLIIVKVVPLICRELHMMAQNDGASSLRDEKVSLQISHHNSLFDLISSLGWNAL
ncbi:interferon regulatory factor 3-like isoform X2 [Misgurnus anguillicaudatus]|uniref:interferon regulatory factor 3-like isoform X2 n=1 Tax=Misgurnus anguillicaudatus TaxID=75329 RepID=UPI003CCF5420